MLYSSTFYKRPLPSPPAVPFSSAEGKELFAEALLQGTMEGFFKLIEQFRTQDEPAFCGLASIAMVLNALAIDPKRAWKGPWRWFHEQMLDCCQPLTQVLQTGIVLDQAACLARCNGALAEVHRHGNFTLEKFRAMVSAGSMSDQEHIVVSYSRKQFLQTGDGHFSPIGGYHADKDMVLILDTARFKYPPHWVPLADLYAAMAPADPATGKPRGYIRLTANPSAKSVMFTLDRPSRAWQDLKHFLDHSVSDILHKASAAPEPHSTGSASQAAVPHPYQASTGESSMSCAKPTRPAEIAPAVTANSKSHPQQASYLKINTSSVKQSPTAATAASYATTNSPLPSQQALSIQPNHSCSVDASQQVLSTAAASATSSNNDHSQQALSTEAQATLSTDPTQQPLSTASAKSTAQDARLLLSQVLQAVPAQALKQALAVRAGSASCCSSSMPCIPVEATKQFLAELHTTQLFQIVQQQLGDISAGTDAHAELHSTQLFQSVDELLADMLDDSRPYAELHSTQFAQAVKEQAADMPDGSGPAAELHSTELPTGVQTQLRQQASDNCASTGMHPELQSTGLAQAAQQHLAGRPPATDPCPELHSTELFPAVQYQLPDMLSGTSTYAGTPSMEVPKKVHQQADTPAVTGTGAEQIQAQLLARKA